jgi:RHS repeat-associated protein
MLYDRAFAPYGESYANAGSTADLNFTGRDQNTISGLYDFQYRRYHPVQGRWLSPDPAGVSAVNPMNPQSWNRYAYVTNNPLALVDPLGLQEDGGCDPDDPDCGGGGDPCFDWGDCGDGGGGGPSGPPTVVQGTPVYGCESLGIPCGGSLNDPLAAQTAAARQAIIAAITGNWQGALGAAIAGASTGLGNIDNTCDFGACAGNQFGPGELTLPAAGTILSAAEALALKLLGVVGLLLMEEGDNVPAPGHQW